MMDLTIWRETLNIRFARMMRRLTWNRSYQFFTAFGANLLASGVLIGLIATLVLLAAAAAYG